MRIFTTLLDFKQMRGSLKLFQSQIKVRSTTNSTQQTNVRVYQLLLQICFLFIASTQSIMPFYLLHNNIIPMQLKKLSYLAIISIQSEVLPARTHFAPKRDQFTNHLKIRETPALKRGARIT